MKTFADFAVEKMMDLFVNHSHEVGSQIAGAYPGKQPTNCITYVLNVLRYAFEKDGNKSIADQVSKLGEKGTELAKFLVKNHKWVGVYYNPDVNHPRDGQTEHPLSRKNLLLSNKYYEIPISYSVINYRPTAKSNPNYKNFSTAYGLSKDPTPSDKTNIDKLKKVKFAVGVSRGGRHTWLFSLGNVYEVHWDQIGSSLYEATALEDFSWLSGALVIPPDAVVAAKFEETEKSNESLIDAILHFFGY